MSCAEGVSAIVDSRATCDGSGIAANHWVVTDDRMEEFGLKQQGEDLCPEDGIICTYIDDPDPSIPDTFVVTYLINGQVVEIPIANGFVQGVNMHKDNVPKFVGRCSIGKGWGESEESCGQLGLPYGINSDAQQQPSGSSDTPVEPGVPTQSTGVNIVQQPKMGAKARAQVTHLVRAGEGIVEVEEVSQPIAYNFSV